jgi:hypothetical protein
MHAAGCTHLVYGLESFDPNILKNLGKGLKPGEQHRFGRHLPESGIIPIPNIIIGFPEETFQSIRNTITALIELGIHAKPHFATAYPGSEWYSGYKDYIRDQYAGNLEAYIQDLGRRNQDHRHHQPPIHGAWSSWACRRSSPRVICACWTYSSAPMCSAHRSPPSANRSTSGPPKNAAQSHNL